MRLRLSLLLAFLLALFFAGGPAAAGETGGQQQRLERLVQVLDYVGVDYAVAVKDGRVISEPEYREMHDFVARARELAGQLPEGEGRSRLLAGLERLGEDIEAKADPVAIRQRTGTLQEVLLQRFPVRAAPKEPPDLARGERLYAERCASCHGAGGRGDGPQAAGLEPPPTNFHNESRVFQRSPFGFFTTVTHGLDGTAMAGYQGKMSEEERWDLAFYVASLPFSGEAADEGAKKLGARPGKWAEVVPSLSALATTSTEVLLEKGGAGSRSVVAHLRRNPGAIEEQSGLPLAVTRQKLAASRDAYVTGQRKRARALAVSAYLDGFESLEPRLDAVDHELRLEVEGAMTRFRSLVAAPGNADKVAALHDRLQISLDHIEQRISGGSLSAEVAFVSSLGILLREGLEALLVVGAILTVLVRTGRREGLPYLHAGWILALLLGGATWFAAQEMIQISGAGREVVEGVSALVAAVILFYVSYWFVSKVEGRKWRAFIQAKVDAAVNHGALWVLALVVFLAVYREVFETILFYQALWAQSANGEGSGPAVLWGVVSAAAILVAVGWGIFRAGIRLPLRAFFVASSALLFVLAVVLAGKGMLALQEAGWVDPTPVAFFRLEWLGIYPYAEPLGLQVLLIVAMAGALLWHFRAAQGGRRGEDVHA